MCGSGMARKASCIATMRPRSAIIKEARMSESSVQAFASAIEALPDSALPPACEADLLAVASALAAG
jgi:hypothetical protein